MGSYSPPTIGPSGLVIPTFNQIKAFLISQYLSIFGQTVYLGPDSADYQDIVVRALQASDCDQAIQLIFLAFNPLTATGPSLDLIGQLIGTTRSQASFSTCLVTLTGTNGTTINAGVIQDINGKFWNLPSSVSIGSSGSITVTATAQSLGNITANVGTIITITTPTAGWSAVTNPDAAIPGVAVEEDSAYRARLVISQAKPSLSLTAGTAAAVAAVANVTRSHVYENPFGYTASYGTCNTSGTAVTLFNGYPIDSSDAGQPITINGVQYSIASVSGANTLVLTSSAGTQSGVNYFIGSAVSLGPAHSITVVVENGASTDIAQAIYNNKNPGVLTNGTTTVTIIDPNNGGISMPISYDPLGYVQIYVYLTVHGFVGFTSATSAAISASLVAYLDSLGIGEMVVYSELYRAALIASPNPDQPLFSIRSLISGSQAASTSATIVIATPTITVASATGIANGQTAVGAGIPPNTTVTLVSGTTITLSVNATASGTAVPVSFFTTGTSDIGVAYNNAPQGSSLFVVVGLV